ncbi:hypothetical protein [Pseudomonas sp. R84]|uniref:hypothetical protein n=1 Tax=Pseudomonas sp. R84 TaxID=1573712 RepID=UPI00135AAF95|nr:hypothetical protein [Pseudomonas sp. R84]
MAEMDDGRMHEKRFVVLDVSEDTFTCVINSRISAFIAKNENKAKCQVQIEASQHPFMSWDSHVDCSRIRTYSRTELVDQLCAHPEWILGMTTPELRERIIAAIKISKTIPSALAAQCCAAFSACSQ